MTLFDVQQRTVLAELSTPYVKYVIWNSDMSMVALLCKHAIIIADKKLQNAQTVHETIRVKVRRPPVRLALPLLLLPHPMPPTAPPPVIMACCQSPNSAPTVLHTLP